MAENNRPDFKNVQVLLERIIDFGKHQVRVGVPAAKAARSDDSALNNAQIAAVNEFGSQDGKTPERSFLRSALVENRHKHSRLMGQAARRVSEGKETSAIALGRVGFIAASDVRHKISTGPFQENADSTKKKKMRENPEEAIKPLIDRGQLIQSIDSLVTKGGSS